MYLVTGSGGLIGSEVAHQLCRKGEQVIGVETNAREYYFGPDASVEPTMKWLAETYIDQYWPVDCGVEHEVSMQELFDRLAKREDELQAVIHCAAQPSHDWAVGHVLQDFEVNALGTLNMLMGVQRYREKRSEVTPKFVYLSTNKVYGDRPNEMAYTDISKRYMPVEDKWSIGFNESMPIDSCLHSFFGCSKLAGDLYAQEYAKRFGMDVMVLRAGCLTGARHKGAELHGFLSYLVKCAVTGEPYTICGHDGRQVRDNLSAYDVWLAIELYLGHEDPTRLPIVYNIGGGLSNSCSILEAIDMVEQLIGRKMATGHGPPRVGDHMWWVTDTNRLLDCLDWEPTVSLEQIMEELVEEAIK